MGVAYGNLKSPPRAVPIHYTLFQCGCQTFLRHTHIFLIVKHTNFSRTATTSACRRGGFMAEKNVDEEVLLSLYKNAHIALQSISDIIGETDDGKMKAELDSEYEGYEKYIGKLSAYMNEIGVEPQDIGVMKKAFMYTTVKMNTLTDDSASHIAELMIKGTVMGITELAEILNNHAKELGEKTHRFTEELKNLEEDYEERLKKLV